MAARTPKVVFKNGVSVYVTDGYRKGMSGVVHDGKATGKSADVNIDGTLHRVANEFLVLQELDAT